MKKTLLASLFLLFFSLNIQAQQISESAEKRIALITRVMAAELGLNESEFIRLKAYNRERIVKGDQIAEFYSNNPLLKAKKLQELETSFDKKFKAMLNPTQLAAYAAYKHDPESDLALQEKNNSANNTNK